MGLHFVFKPIDLTANLLFLLKFNVVYLTFFCKNLAEIALHCAKWIIFAVCQYNTNYDFNISFL